MAKRSTKTPKQLHGGARAGSGRKLTGRITVTFRVAAMTAAFLRAQDHPGAMIDILVAEHRRTAGER